MNIKEKFQKIKEDYKAQRAEYYSPDNKYERMKATSFNKKAQQAFAKKIANVSAESALTEEQEAIIFSQVYELLTLKNPAAAKFPEFEEYQVEKTEKTYKISGYVDGTNSYGAQMRTNYSMEVMKKDGEWACLNNGAGKLLLYIILGLLILGLPSISYWIYLSILR